MINANSRYMVFGVEPFKRYAPGSTGAVPSTRTDLATTQRYTSWTASASAIAHVARPGETFLSLAQQYYGDQSKWWVIADHNPEVQYPLDLASGDSIVIPDPAIVGLASPLL